MKKNLIASFLLIFILLGCQIVKRQHLPGYHIELNHKIKPGEKELKDEKRSKTYNTEDLTIDSVLTKKYRSTYTEILQSYKTEVVDRASSIEEKILIPKFEKLSRKAVEKRAEKQKKENKSIENTKKKSILGFIYTVDSETLRVIGLVLLIFGGVLLIISLIYWAGSFDSGGGSSSSDSGSSGSSNWNFFGDLFANNTGAGCLTALIILIVFILIVWLFYLLIKFALGGPLVGTIVGGSLVVLGLLFLYWAYRRD